METFLAGRVEMTTRSEDHTHSTEEHIYPTEGPLLTAGDPLYYVLLGIMVLIILIGVIWRRSRPSSSSCCCCRKHYSEDSVEARAGHPFPSLYGQRIEEEGSISNDRIWTIELTRSGSEWVPQNEQDPFPMDQDIVARMATRRQPGEARGVRGLELSRLPNTRLNISIPSPPLPRIDYDLPPPSYEEVVGSRS